MGKKTIFLCNGGAGQDGVIRAMARYANGIYEEGRYNVELFFKNGGRELENNLKDFNPNIKINYVKPYEMVERTKSFKSKNLFSKIIYNLLMSYNKYYVQKKSNEFFKNREDAVALIDFDMSMWKYIKNIDILKVGRFSFSLAGGYRRDGIKKRGKRLRAYDKLIAISKDMVKELEHYDPTQVKKVVQIYNPIDLSKATKDSEDKSSLTEEERELIEKKYIVSVGRLNRVKGCHEIIESVKRLRDKGVIINYYIIGNGDEKNNLEKLIKHNKLEKQVYLLGRKSNVFVWIKNSIALTHASYGEGLPNTLIEAMAVSTPIIAYDCPTGPNDILQGGKYGELVKLGDINMLTDSIEKIIVNEEYRLKLKERMKIRVEDFKMEKSILEMIKFLNKSIEEKK